MTWHAHDEALFAYNPEEKSEIEQPDQGGFTNGGKKNNKKGGNQSSGGWIVVLINLVLIHHGPMGGF